MSRTLSDEELAQLSESGRIKTRTTRERLISVINILAEQTDEDEGMTAKEIARCIATCCGCSPSEKAVLDDLHAIETGRPLGLSVLPAKKGENVGFRCTGRPLSPNEALTAASLVKTSMFMNPSQRDSLARKLRSIALPVGIKADEAETVYVDERESYGAADVLRAITIASQAIDQNERVSFRIATHLMNGSESLTATIEEDPVAIVFSFGRYYLATVGVQCDGLPVRRFRRLDRIRAIIATGKPQENIKQVEEFRARIPVEVRERVDMLGEEDTKIVVLKVSGSYAKHVYDRFGHNTEFFGVDEATATGLVCLKVRASPTLYRWLIGMCDGIVLVKPDVQIASHLATLPWVGTTEPNRGALHARLVSDYRAIKAGLLQLTRHAQELYEPERL